MQNQVRRIFGILLQRKIFYLRENKNALLCARAQDTAPPSSRLWQASLEQGWRWSNPGSSNIKLPQSWGWRQVVVKSMLLSWRCMLLQDLASHWLQGGEQIYDCGFNLRKNPCIEPKQSRQIKAHAIPLVATYCWIHLHVKRMANWHVHNSKGSHSSCPL